MPIKNDPTAVTRQIQHALRNNILSSREANRLVREIKKDGVTEAEVDAVVKTLQAALAGSADSLSIDVSTRGRQKTINRFLGRLNDAQPLPLQGASGGRPTGSVNWLQLMTQQSEAVAEPLPERSFGGREVGVDTKGGLTLGDHRISFEGTPSTEMNEALWALNQGGQMDSLDSKSRAALQKNLLGLVRDHIATPNDAEGKFKKLVATAAATGALVDSADSWDSEMIDSALELAGQAPNPMTKSLLLRGLGNAALSADQKAQLDAIEVPEHSEALLKSYDSMRNETARIGYSTVKNEAAEFALSALTFAKTPAAIENIESGMKSWKDLNSDYSNPWDGEEIGHMNQILEGYVDKYPQTAFQYGTFSKEAPKRIADVTNARAVAEVAPQLEGSSPSIGGFPLTREQADFIQTLLPNIQDEASVKTLVRTLATADGMFKSRMPNSYGSIATPAKPMSPAAFEMFKKAAAEYQETAGGTKTGKLDYSSFRESFSRQCKTIHSKLRPRLAELNGNPPRWGNTQLSAEAAQFIQTQMEQHTRSEMSVDNMGRAIQVFAQQHGGKLEGAAFEQFQSMITEYKANWPGVQTFDFNKLERIASYKVQGKDLPLCSINGKQVGLAEFYDKVGMDVSNAIDPSRQRHDWMADRWGYRAKEAVELLDVVAEQTARNEGPVATLRDRFPGRDVEIQATGRDGAHEQFLYVVKDGYRTRTYAQGSDGELRPYRGRNNPVLFSASIGQEGELNVQVPERIRAHRYPLQTTYSVGDKIDLHYNDYNATERHEEGKPFETKSKILEGEIVGYDASGRYQVKFTNPEGKEITKNVNLSEIRRTNNPHYFKSRASYFSDTTINLQTDKALKTFLEEAQPIIDSYLPADGSTVTMSPQELAKRQKDCIKALMKYTRERVKYPASKGAGADEASAKYHEFVDGGRFPLGELIKIGKGVCRHQCILEHLLLQQAGIESRLASGSANTSSGNFRGFHIWTEVTLADNERYLSDQTWNDTTIPLWEGAYGTDKRRTEMYYRTARYDRQIELD